MFEYVNVYFNWLDDIREYKYFLQSLLLNICNRNLCWHFETSSDLLFKSSHWFVYMSMANFSWRHKEHRFMFVYGGAVWIIFHINVGVSFFCFLYFPNITGESCAVQIVLILKWLGVIIISLLFKLTLCKAKIHFFGVEMLLMLYTCKSHFLYDNHHYVGILFWCDS